MASFSNMGCVCLKTWSSSGYKYLRLLEGGWACLGPVVVAFWPHSKPYASADGERVRHKAILGKRAMPWLSLAQLLLQANQAPAEARYSRAHLNVEFPERAPCASQDQIFGLSRVQTHTVLIWTYLQVMALIALLKG